MGSKEVVIYNTFDSFEAESVVALFESEGIPSYKREHGAGQYISILFGTNTTQSIEIVIPEDCEEKALQALEGAGFIAPLEDEDVDDDEEDEYIGAFVEFHGIKCRVSYIEGHDEEGAFYRLIAYGGTYEQLMNDPAFTEYHMWGAIARPIVSEDGSIVWVEKQE